jgi:hypothetical protein
MHVWTLKIWIIGEDFDSGRCWMMLYIRWDALLIYCLALAFYGIGPVGLIINTSYLRVW